MRLAVFDTHAYDRRSLGAAAAGTGHALTFFEPRLTAETVALASGFEAVCVFVNDRLDAPTLQALQAGGTRLVALRCAGFNNVD
ncbi:MAG: ldhA, partial [Cyanobacteria bacterium RYN_339]|nr:ldhA [Cyanobacteria bacterium RYN_339]